MIDDQLLEGIPHGESVSPEQPKSEPKVENIESPSSSSFENENKQESQVEQSQEKQAEKKVEEIKTEEQKQIEGGLSAVSTTTSIQQRREEAIDKILSEGLNDIFLKMPPNKQKEFQEKGEETVKKINVLLGEAKVKVNKIVDLIKRWLRIIPGVNKFFLEQETKLKVDKIMKIKNKI